MRRVSRKLQNNNVPRELIAFLTLILTANILLAVVLLLVPYLSYLAFHEEVYYRTKSSGLDPRDWWPFSGEGVGLVLYNISYGVWALAACLAVPFALSQLSLVHRHWESLGDFERKLHLWPAILTVGLACFMITIGLAIVSWLMD